MNFPIHIDRMCLFQIVGLLGAIFRFIQNTDQTPYSAAADMGLHCLPMSHKKNARLIWVKINMFLLCKPHYSM